MELREVKWGRCANPGCNKSFPLAHSVDSIYKKGRTISKKSQEGRYTVHNDKFCKPCSRET